MRQHLAETDRFNPIVSPTARSRGHESRRTSSSSDGTLSRRRVVQGVAMTATTLLSGCAFNPLEQGPPPGQLFVENRTNSAKRIALSVSNTGTPGDPRIHNEYRIPEESAIQFDGVFEPQQTYDIRAFQPNAPAGAREHLVVLVETCEQGSPSSTMDVVILASSNGPDVLTFGCDRPYSPPDYLTLADPSQFEIASVDGTLAPPTTS